MVSQNGPLSLKGETVVCRSGLQAKGPVTVTASKKLHHAGETVCASNVVFKAPEIQVYRDSLVAGSHVTLEGDRLGIQGNILKQGYHFKFGQLHATKTSFILPIPEETPDFIEKRLGSGPSQPVQRLGSKVSFDPAFRGARHDGVVKTKKTRTFRGTTFIQGPSSVCESEGSLEINASQSVVNEGTVISQGGLKLATLHLHQVGRIGVTEGRTTLKVGDFFQDSEGVFRVAGDLTLEGRSVHNEGHLEVGETFQGRLFGDFLNQKLVSCGAVDLRLDGTFLNTPGTFGVRSVFLSKGPMEIRGLSQAKAEEIHNRASLMESLQGLIRLKARKVFNLREVALGKETQVWRRHNASLQDLPPELEHFKKDLRHPKFLRSDWTIRRSIYDPSLSEPEALLVAGGGDLFIHADFLENGSSNLQAKGRVGLFGGTYYNHGEASATHMVHTWVEEIHEIWSSNSWRGGSTKPVEEPRTFEEPIRLAVEVPPSGIIAGQGFIGVFKEGVRKAHAVALFSDFPKLTPAEQMARNQTIAFYNSTARTEGIRRYPVGDFLPSGPVSDLQKGEVFVESYGAAFAPQPQTIKESLAHTVLPKFQDQLVRTVKDLVSSGLVGLNPDFGKAREKRLGGVSSALTGQAPTPGELAWKQLWKHQDTRAFVPQRKTPHLLLRTQGMHVDPRTFISSDYFLSRVNVFRNDPERLLRLGDAFVECRLIRDQLLQLTGHPLLRGFSDEAFMIKALYEAGAAFVKDLQRHKLATKEGYHPPKDMLILEPVEMMIPAKVEGALAQLSQALALTQEAVTKGLPAPMGAMKVIEIWAPRLYLSEETLAKWRGGTVGKSILTKFEQTADLSGQTFEALGGSLTHVAQQGLLQHGGANQARDSVNLMVPEGRLDQVSACNEAGKTLNIAVQQLVQRRDNPEGFHTHGTTRHVGPPMTNSAGQDVRVSVDTETLLLGVDIRVKRNIRLNLKGKAAIGSVTREYRASLGGDACWHRDEVVSHEVSHFIAGRQIQATLGDDLIVAGLKAKARQSIKLKGKKNIGFLGVQNFTRHARFAKSDGGWLGKSTREEVSHTRLESLPDEFKAPLSIVNSDGNLLNVGTQYSGKAVLQVKGKATLQAAETLTDIQENRQSTSLIWQSASNTGAFHETYRPVAALGGLTLQTPHDGVFELPQGQKLPENLTVERLPASALEGNPAWGPHGLLESLAEPEQPGMHALSEQPGQLIPAAQPEAPQLQVKHLQEIHKRWNQTRQGLTPGAAALFGLAITLTTGAPLGNLAGSLTGATQGFAYAATKAGMQAVASATVVGTVNHQGNLGKALEDLGKPQALRSIAASIATAGLVEDLTTRLKLPDTPKTLTQHAQRAAVKSAISVPINAMLGGQKLEEALLSGATTFAADTLGCHFATEIGKAYGAKKLSYGEHKALHAFVGAVTGAILNPADLGKGALSGALGAFVAEVVGEAVIGDMRRLAQKTMAEAALEGRHLSQQELLDRLEPDREFAKNIGQIAAAGVALLSRQDVDTVIHTAQNATENNLVQFLIVGGLAAWTAYDLYAVYEKEGPEAALKQAGVEVVVAVVGGTAIKRGFKIAGKIYPVAEAAWAAYAAENPALAKTGEFLAGALEKGKNLLGGGAGKAAQAPSRNIALEALDLNLAGEYRAVAGHHVHAKKAFEGQVNYDPRKGFSISDELMKKTGIDHSRATTAQQKLFRELAASGSPNTMREHTRIAVEALMEGGCQSRDVARKIVAESLQSLRKAGVAQPTTIPWGPTVKKK
jgi:Possible hemagglutinin (DUF637)